MTIIEMAKQAGASKLISKDSVEHALTSTAKIEAFAKLVAAKEREACIAIAESKRHSPNFHLTSMPPQNGTAVDIANLIRERGEA